MTKFTNGNKRQGKKLTGEQVWGIREMYKTGGYTQVDLARMFDVSLTTIANIVNGVSWKGMAGYVERSVVPPKSDEEIDAMAAETEKELIKAFESKPKGNDKAYGARFVETANVEMPQRFIDEMGKLEQTEGMLDELKNEAK